MNSSVVKRLREKVIADPAYGEAVRCIFDSLGDVENKRVFESGCGDGSCSVLFALGGATIIGVDPNPKRIARAAELAESLGLADRCTFVEGNSEDCPIESSSVDCVFSKSALQYMDRSRVLDEMVRVLKPGGSIALIENLPSNPFVVCYRFVRRTFATSKARRAYADSIKGYLGPSDIARLSRHFEKTELGHYHLTRMVTLLSLGRRPNSKTLIWLDTALARFDSCLLRRFPLLKRFAWIVSVYCNRKLDADKHLAASHESDFNQSGSCRCEGN